jgi:hypothetical protein
VLRLPVPAPLLSRRRLPPQAPLPPLPLFPFDMFSFYFLYRCHNTFAPLSNRPPYPLGNLCFLVCLWIYELWVSVLKICVLLAGSPLSSLCGNPYCGLLVSYPVAFLSFLLLLPLPFIQTLSKRECRWDAKRFYPHKPPLFLPFFFIQIFSTTFGMILSL